MGVALMLARLGGNDKPSKEDVTAILDSVGIKPETAKLDALFADLEKLSGSVDDAIKAGMDKLAVIPSGGGGGGGASGGAATGGGDAKKADEPEEESESKSSSKAGGNLFGADDSDSDSDSDSD